MSSDAKSPYYDYLGVAVSADGRTATGYVEALAHASAPDGTRMPDGSIGVYFNSGETGGPLRDGADFGDAEVGDTLFACAEDCVAHGVAGDTASDLFDDARELEPLALRHAPAGQELHLAFAHLPVHRVDRRGFDAHEHFARGGFGDGDVGQLENVETAKGTILELPHFATCAAKASLMMPSAPCQMMSG